MTTSTLSTTTPLWTRASLDDENSFYIDEKTRFVNQDCKHRLKGGQCILRAKHIGKHVISFNKSILSILVTNNILVKMMQSNWRV